MFFIIDVEEEQPEDLDLTTNDPEDHLASAECLQFAAVSVWLEISTLSPPDII